MALTRRNFLTSSLASIGMVTLPRAQAWAAPGEGIDPVLVVVFQRGAADGLNLVIPRGDADYYNLRPTIQVAPGTELDLNGPAGFYGLYPGLSDLLPLYDSGKLAIVHACGSPDATRSHFSAQDFMERAAPGDLTVTTGWLNRALGAIGATDAHAGVGLESATAVSLQGPQPTLAFTSLASFGMTGAYRPQRRAAFEPMFGADPGSLLGTAAAGLFSSLDLFAAVDRSTTVTTYPAGGFASDLKDAAALIKADVGVRVLAIDTGWDHHSDELVNLDNMTPGFAAALAAFQEDLGAAAPRTVTLVMTEFGRTAGENEAGGSEHGHGGAMFVMSDKAAGGQVITKNGWPGLSPGALNEGRDLVIDTDFRHVFAEVLDSHLGVSDPSSLLPNFASTPADYPGVLV